MSAFTDLIERFDNRLAFNHPCLRITENAVLHAFQSNRLTIEAGAWLLGQYALLPSRIVSFLRRGAEGLQIWPAVNSELCRNIDEELGSRTDGIPHFVILKSTLLKEVGLDLSQIHPDVMTDKFLKALKGSCESGLPSFVAGAMLALEASALPELEIVAAIINEYGRLRQFPVACIRLERLSDSESVARIRADKMAQDYTIEDFFVLHILDFEVGHKSGLQHTIQKYIVTDTDFKMLESGFEAVLTAMDEWWSDLASSASALTDQCAAESC